MRFQLSFSMDNDAFDGGDNSVDEVCRILHDTADALDAVGAEGGIGATIRDINGNTIGLWEVVDDE
jgi:hypothetical protein